MNALLAAAAEIQSFLRRTDERSCFIGGMALQRWGEPRFTRDIDLTLLSGRDWADDESTVIRQSHGLDWALVFQELAPLAEVRGGTDIEARLRRLKQG